MGEELFKFSFHVSTLCDRFARNTQLLWRPIYVVFFWSHNVSLLVYIKGEQNNIRKKGFPSYISFGNETTTTTTKHSLLHQRERKRDLELSFVRDSNLIEFQEQASKRDKLSFSCWLRYKSYASS